MLEELKKLGARVYLAFALAALMAVPALATGESGGAVTVPSMDGVTGAFTTALEGLVPTILTAVGGIAVVALAIFGARYALSFGLRLFKTDTGR